MFDIATKYCFHLDNDNTNGMEIFLLLYSLEKYVNGAIIEINRLERTRKNISKKLNLHKKGNITRKDFQLTYLACDTHFFFICIDKCYKLIKQIGLELNDKEIEKLSDRLNKNYNIAIVRNHLEHIEDRCKGYLNLNDKNRNKKKHISDFGNFVGDHFSFNNIQYPSDRKSLKELIKIYSDLIEIVDNRARKDPWFVEKEEMETNSKHIMKIVKKAWLMKK
jgi:hypothetical protein